MKANSMVAVAVTLAAALGLGACEGGTAAYPTKDKGASAPRMSNEAPRETVFGAEGLFGSKNKGGGEAAGIGVNSFLWRASLDTIGFMPLAGTPDPFGGTIITDWYAPPETPNERFKINIFILDRALRADGVKANVFKQVRDGSGQWVDSRVEPKVAADLENAILTRARQLRIVSTE